MASSLLSTGVSGLLAFQKALSVTGNNIANVNTEGYSRQRIDFSAREPQFTGAGFLGTGVDVGTIERVYDQFLVGQVRTSTSAVASLDSFYEFSAQIDNLMADPNVGLDPALNRFFGATQGLANDPASVPARQVLLTESEILVSSFNNLGESLNSLRDRLNSELRVVTGQITALSSSIASINEDIVIASGLGGGLPNDLLDQRDKLIGDLSELVDVTVVNQDDGAANVFIGNGQALVVGNTPSSLSVSNGSFDATQVEINITTGTGSTEITSSLSGGQIGGLLDFRRDVLNTAQNSLGRISMALTEDMNAQHAMGVDLNGQLGGAYFLTSTPTVLPNVNNAGGTVSAALVDANQLTVDDYLLRFDGGSNYTLLNLTDNSTTAITTGGASPFTTATIDGFNLTISSGAAVGDTFLVQPTRNGSTDIAMAITSTDQFAAAAPIVAGPATDANGLPLNTGTSEITLPEISNTTNIPLSGAGGDITLTFDPNALGAGVPGFTVTGGPGGTLAFDPATESAGKSFTLTGFGDMTFSVSGVPATGDAFVITDNTTGFGDNRNAMNIARLQSASTLSGGTATYQESYGQTVSDVGTRTLRADVNRQAQQGLLNQAISERESVSGVNLDEEAANLLIFQTAYQAAAQVISTTNTVFQTLINSFGR